MLFLYVVVTEVEDGLELVGFVVVVFGAGLILVAVGVEYASLDEFFFSCQFELPVDGRIFVGYSVAFHVCVCFLMVNIFFQQR